MARRRRRSRRACVRQRRSEAALDGAVHVQENTPEDVDVKREVFAQARRRRSARRGARKLDLGDPAVRLHREGLSGRARCLVVHPINPPYLIPAAEVVPAPWTAAGVVERTAAFLRAAGHAPIVMKREIDGFVMNRLQGALLEEAFRLVADGYAGVEDVDIGIRDGLALRWSFMGPFETIDLNAPGGDTRLRRALPEDLFGHLPFDPVASRLERAGDGRSRGGTAQAPARPDKLVERQAWRDRRLMALARTSGAPTGTSGAEAQGLGKEGRAMASSNKVIITCAVTRRDPHAVDVALSAGDALTRSPRRRSAPPRRERRSSICTRATRRPAGPTRALRPSRASCRASSSRRRRW